ncbi:atypical/ABC1/ABC1-C protein kinase [Magnaporthiopsis poae ATCC 64411]|uniref:Atypical/ABC1/ABC1-C protein kinase n=1 Tax=Magnaporthiopsis poae (strain ATCC 64411 / 73-15) TaxID=644358 RepID=A0A0C4DP24_MAGP6|nr:atypical/ABC1/ABC1-C protein kinase [Magnaporthiopsis poae ATCC 64411]
MRGDMSLPGSLCVRLLSRLGRGSSVASSRLYNAANTTHPATATHRIRHFCRSSSRVTRTQDHLIWFQLRRPRTGCNRGEHKASGGGRGSYSRTNAPLMAKMSSGAGAAALGTAAFVQLSEEENGDDDETGEDRMLAASRREIAKKIRDDDRGLSRLGHQIVLLLDLYVWEPLCTGFRFLHLAALFVPVILAVPAVWVGRRVPERDNERTGTLWWYGLLVKSMELAGPTFIKLGQWAASRSDIFPNEMCDTMSRLHSNAPAHSLHATRRIVEAAFNGMPFDSIFDEFDETPLGVGAIAQVYRAKLKPGLASPADVDVGAGRGRKRGINVRKKVETVLKSTPKRVPSSHVAVKVLHPRVERTVRRDLRIMGFFAAAINAIPTMHWLSLPDEVAQFGEMMRLQLDLRIEAANLTIFRKHFRDRSTAWFPFPYPEFTTRNVLIEEFATGIPLADFMENGGGVFQHDIAAEGLDAFLRMLLIDNFVHADLHPGNIMVRFYQAEKPNLPNLPKLPQLQRHGWRGTQEGDDGVHEDEQQHSDSHDTAAGRQQLDVTEQVLSRLRPYRHRKDKAAWEEELRRIDEEGFRPQLLFIDTGLVTELNATNRRNFLDLFRAVAEFDGYKAGHLMCERCRQPDAVLDADVFALKMQHLVLEVKSSTLALGNVRIGDILQRVLAMVRAHHVRMEGDFVNVVISIFLLEGIGRALNPDLDLLSSALPILRELSAQSGADMVKQGDFSMIMVWMGLEARRFMQASIEDVERCVKYDQLSPNI